MIEAKKNRRRRGEQQKNLRPIVLTQRDIRIMMLIGLCRYCSTDHIKVEFFPDATICRCRRRLRQLYDAGYLQVTLTSSTKPNLYSLSSQGLKKLGEQENEFTAQISLAGTIRLAGIPHHLAVIDARLYIAALGKSCVTPLVAWSNSGGAIGQKIGLDNWCLEPDGIAELETKNGIFRIAVEVDCGTESTKVLVNKLEKYAGLAHMAVLNELWFVVTTGKQRMGTIARLVRKIGVGSWTKIMHQKYVTKRPLQNPPGYVVS